MLTQCIAYAKLVYNKKINAYKVQIAFNVHKELVGTNYKYKFPVQSKCAFVSGDIDATEVLQVLHNASRQLNTSNIQIVE